MIKEAEKVVMRGQAKKTEINTIAPGRESGKGRVMNGEIISGCSLLVTYWSTILLKLLDTLNYVLNLIVSTYFYA